MREPAGKTNIDFEFTCRSCKGEGRPVIYAEPGREATARREEYYLITVIKVKVQVRGYGGRERGREECERERKGRQARGRNGGGEVEEGKRDVRRKKT